MFSSLDVGCGISPRGKVNCDLYFSPIQRGHGIINPKIIPNLVWSDVQFLPFKKNSFILVTCFHVIEHVKNPFQLLKELLRVSKNRVVVKCPHRLKPLQSKKHIHRFNASWFEKIIPYFNVNYIINYSKYGGFPHPFFNFFRVPYEITITLWGCNEIIC